MKNISSRFAALGTALRANEFRRALVRISALYIGILAVIIGFFTFAILSEVESELDGIALVRIDESSETVLLSVDTALARARDAYPGVAVSSYETELEEGEIVTGVVFEDGAEVKVNHRTGGTRLEPPKPFVWSSLFDDLHEMIIVIGLCVFLVSSAGAVILARAILAPIRENMHAQERFVADAAHELRNPLAAVQIALEALRKAPPPDRDTLAQELAHVEREHRRLIALSESILTLAHAGKTRSGAVPHIRPQESVERVLAQLAPRARERQVTVLAETGDVLLSCRAEDFERILHNLLDNAIKFSKEGGTIRIRWTRDRVLEVADSGIGVSPEDSAHIFERFYRADASRSLAEGHGLGLSIVKSIADAYGAEVSVMSTLGKGTTVSVHFLQ